MAARQSREEQQAGSALLNRFGGPPQKPGDTKRPDSNEVPPVTVPGFAVPGTELAGSIAKHAGAVVKDIAKGATVELGRAVWTGARDAFQNTYDMADDYSRWANDKISKKTGFYGFAVGTEGSHLLTEEEGRQLNDDARARVDSKTVADPKTVTGGLIKGVAQFLTGLVGVNKTLGVLSLPSKIEGAAGVGLAALKGAAATFAAFDPHQERLSNLVQKYPALANPVNEYLASKPGDSNSEGRFKNAMEGLGIGGLTDGMVKGVKLLKGVAASHAHVEAAGTPPVDPAPRALDEAAFNQLGDVKQTALLTNDVPPVTLPAANDAGVPLPPIEPGAVAAAGAEPPQTFINFARIDAPEDVKKVMQLLSDQGSVAPDSARAGTRSFETVKLDAAHRDAWKALQSRRQGEPLSDADSLAARNLWAATTEKLAEVAETAATNPSEPNLFAFRKMLEVHDMVQREVLGARASAARSLASWRIPAGGGAERLKAVSAMLEATGGGDVTRTLAERVATAARIGPKEMAAVAEKGMYATTRDAVVEAWINGLLSNPVTHVANTISNLTVLPLRMAERAIASKIGQVLGDEGVAAGEAAAQWAGAMQGFRDMFRYYAKVSRALLPSDSMLPVEGAGPSPLSQLNVPQFTKLEHPPSISSDAFRISSETHLGRAVDLLGSTVRAPGLALNASDEFFKTVGYRMELNAQAVRQATSEVSAGKIGADAFKARVAEIVANPPENIRLASADAALYQTFTNAPGFLGKTLGKLTATYPALKVILPFTRTPSNILNYTFERTPFAPLQSKFRADIAAGGARRDLALAQMALGTLAMGTAADMTMSGNISGRGPLEKGLKEAMSREGWQPYSMKIGSKWYSYNRLDPSGSLLGMAADATELLMEAQHESIDDEATEKLYAAVAFAFAANITNKTYLSGLADTFAAFSEPQSADKWLQRTAGSVVPAGAAQAERLDDPIVRETYSMMDAIRARTLGLSKDLPARRDFWGYPVKQESGIGKGFDAFSPVYTRPANRSPIDDEIVKQGFNLMSPGARQTFKLPYAPKGDTGVSIDMSKYPRAYSDFIELAGHKLENPRYGGVGLKDLLNSIVTGDHPLSAVYAMGSDGPDGKKEVMLRDLVSQYRDLAKQEVLERYPALRAEVERKADAQRALKYGQ